MKLFRIGLLAALMVGFLGCQKSNELLEADIQAGDAEFAIPLLKANTSIQDLLENFDDYTYIEVDSAGVVHLRYQGDVLTQTADEFFNVIDTFLPVIIPIDSSPFPLDFSSVGSQLKVDFARYSTGSVNASVYTEYQGLVNFSLTIHEATKNGQPLTIQSQFMAPIGFQINGTHIPIPPDLNAAVPVYGYELQPIEGKVHIEYAAVTETGDTLDLAPGDVWLNNTNINFSYIEGYLGNFTNKGKRDFVGIEFFEDWIQGDVFFEKPVIKINIENSFGLPTRSKIDTFDILTADGRSIPLESDFIDSTGIDFVYPTVAEAGQSKTMTFTFDANNSNIEDVLGSRPIGLDYKVDAISNPDSIVGIRGFLTDSSFYKIQIEVDLPLHGRASGFGAIDEFDLDFSDYDALKEVEFKLVADNGMPLAIDAQAYFLDGSGVVLDSLFDEIATPIAAAPVDADGVVIEKETTTTFVTFDAVRFDKIRKAKKLKLHAYFSTTNGGQQSVKAFSNQEVEIRMGMKVKV